MSCRRGTRSTRAWWLWPLAALPGLACAGLACAEREVVTWEEAAPTHASLPRVTPPQAPRVEDAEPPRLTVRRRAGETIDRALARFRAARARSDALPPESGVHGAHWLDVIEAIDRACLVAPTADDLGAFVRARVTLEVEYQLDRERRRALPEDLDQRIARALGSVDERVNELRLSGAPGTLRPSPPPHGGAVVLRAPLYPMVVTSAFGVRNDPVHGRRRFHAGIDLGAPEGTMVYAAASGLVVYAGWQGGFGRHVVLDHGHGVRTHYSHLSQLFVKPGEMLEAGDTLGAVGSTGRATGPHLHFAVTNADGRFLDPLRALGVALGGDDPSPRVSRAP